MTVIESGSGGEIASVGAVASVPLHVASYPVPYGSGGYYRVGAVSGTVAAALAANSEIVQFRYVTAASRLAAVYRVSISAGANVAATAAGLAAFRMTIARAWTADGTGGTAMTLTGDNAQLRTSMAASEVSSLRVATTAALGAGTKTLDTPDCGAVAYGIGTGALTVSQDFSILPPTELMDSLVEGVHPLLLANQEGFVIRIGSAMPATMTWHFAVNVCWAEIPAF